ncbi:MAG TPA: ABC transporter permease subunit [Fimbriimonas sp.]|nr:ABC transporter permease subunit [Fimbriimonas sp.]
MASPIADLSYRNYDGPLEKPLNRWWAIAKASMRLSIKKKGFWILASLSAYWYLLLLIVFYFMDAVSQNVPIGQKNPFIQQIIWKDQFLNAFSIAQMLLFIIALLIGVGAIANDNRANALLVYLSKPVSRLDYLIGKWLGIFIPITIVVALPTLAFFGYCTMSYREYGFLTEDPRLLPKLLLLIFVPGFFHASVSLGISSMFNQGRLAGATYAGIFFMTLFFTKAMQIVHLVTSDDGGKTPPIVNTLYYCSVDGIQIALAKIILSTDGSGLFPNQPSGGRGIIPTIPMPNPALFIGVYFGICALSLLLAWSRIRAVEVVA